MESQCSEAQICRASEAVIPSEARNLLFAGMLKGKADSSGPAQRVALGMTKIAVTFNNKL
jgi:hypothetical protein